MQLVCVGGREVRYMSGSESTGTYMGSEGRVRPEEVSTGGHVLRGGIGG